MILLFSLGFYLFGQLFINFDQDDGLKDNGIDYFDFLSEERNVPPEINHDQSASNAEMCENNDKKVEKQNNGDAMDIAVQNLYDDGLEAQNHAGEHIENMVKCLLFTVHKYML